MIILAFRFEDELPTSARTAARESTTAKSATEATASKTTTG
jgi:hypothetical protein